MPVAGLELPFGVKVTNPVPVDPYTGPFDSLPNALLAIPVGVRYVGREFIVVIDGNAIKYQFYSGIADLDVAMMGSVVIDDYVTSSSSVWSSEVTNDNIIGRLLKYDAEIVETIPVNLASVTSNSYVFDGISLGTKSVYLTQQVDKRQNGVYAWLSGAFTKIDYSGERMFPNYNSRLIIAKYGTNAGKIFAVRSYVPAALPEDYEFTYWQVGGSTSGGSEVTDSAKRTALKLNTNWVNPNDAEDKLYFKMTLNLPTGQSEHDYYIGIDTSTNTAFKYIYEKIDGDLTWVRIPMQISISGL